jgi:hypothetical protein
MSKTVVYVNNFLYFCINFSAKLYRPVAKTTGKKRWKSLFIIQMKKHLIIAFFALLSIPATAQESSLQSMLLQHAWGMALDMQLPLFGHRNWILIVDKAYPEQSAAGIETIYTGANQEEVVKQTLQKIADANHITPIIYTDRELQFLTDSLVQGVDSLIQFYEKTFTGFKSFSVIHDEIFPKIDKAAEQFKILVLKTNSTIPYSSVFIELDCGYWNEQSEKALREKMKR